MPHAPVDVTYPLGRWSWTRDGTHILYTHDDLLYTTDRDGKSNRLITHASVRVFEINQTRDGSKIVYTGGDGRRRNIYESRIDGTQLRHLTTDASDTEPSWSPDMKRIVFVRTHGSRAQIMVINADGSDLHSIGGSATDLDHPVWLPAQRP